MDSILSLRDYGVCFGKRRILSNINFDIDETGITHILGPCGSGKSTLFRSLAGMNNKSSLFRTHGEAFYMGEALGLCDQPVMLEQKPAHLLVNIFESLVANLPERATLDQQQQKALVVRLLDFYELHYFNELLDQPMTQLSLADRRLILILSIVATAPAMIMLDEPTAGLEEEDADKILRLIDIIGEKRAVMLVQHNQQQAKKLGGRAFLLAGGIMQEDGSTEQLLTAPCSVAGQEFMGSGTCATPALDAKPEELDEGFLDRYNSVIPEVSATPIKIPFGPRGFRWITRNSLAATPRPGLLSDLELDLKSLAKVKIDWLVCLEMEKTVPEQDARERGIRIRHLPIEDMQVPSVEEARKLAEEINGWLKAGKRIAVHCKAGLGRTGTIIAVYFVYTGLTPEQAIQKVRNVEPRMIQSNEQEVFITNFFGYLKQAS
ncbi:MAG: ATP-binding cassette domain-containing protein [Gammaproteobacteria bacterium]|nr:ATP-binding cassette domain-containing protein [Gammaproteobacteria bacterium]